MGLSGPLFSFIVKSLVIGFGLGFFIGSILAIECVRAKATKNYIHARIKKMRYYTHIVAVFVWLFFISHFVLVAEGFDYAVDRFC